LPLGYCSQPAAQAGHSVVAGLFAALGAIAVGGTARARMSILTEPALRPVLRSAQPRGRLGRRPRAALRGLSSLGWISADVGSSNMTATSRSCPRLRLSRGSRQQTTIRWLGALLLALVCAATSGHLSARPPFFSFDGNAGFLFEPIVRGHVSKMLFSAREHLASIGLIWPKADCASIA
jgi:hypothetical protein